MTGHFQQPKEEGCQNHDTEPDARCTVQRIDLKRIFPEDATSQDCAGQDNGDKQQKAEKCSDGMANPLRRGTECPLRLFPRALPADTVLLHIGGQLPDWLVW
jgi:hypothetical protein